MKTTAKKVRANRGWCAAVTDEALEAAVAALEVVYVPQGVNPGPAFLFPVRDVSGDIMRAQVRLAHENYGAGTRYLSLTDKARFVGPSWLGNDEATLEAIILGREVLVVEGPFDLLAIRAAGVRVPSMSSLTKRLGPMHLDYLRILGVQKIHIMFDVDPTGGGKIAAEATQRNVKDMEVSLVTCPAHDPADALKSALKLKSLRSVLDLVNTDAGTHQLVGDED